MASKRVLFYLRSSHPDEREMRHIPPEAFQRGRGVYLRNGGVWQAGDIEGVEKDADGVLSLTSEAVGRVVAHREDLLSAYRKHYRLADSDIDAVRFEDLDAGPKASPPQAPEPLADEPRTTADLRAWLADNGVAYAKGARKADLQRLYREAQAA